MEAVDLGVGVLDELGRSRLGNGGGSDDGGRLVERIGPEAEEELVESCTVRQRLTLTPLGENKMRNVRRLLSLR